MCVRLLVLMAVPLFTFSINASTATFMSTGKEYFLTDALLRNVVDRMGKDLVDGGDSYLDFSENNRVPLMGVRSTKDFESEERMFPLDYDSLGEATNLNPSIRDQEYLQHSSLWGNQYMSGGAGEGKQHLKPEGTSKNRQETKTDSALPAYCNPPNPCPFGYEEDQGCISPLKFENTAAFSREYQRAQDCMCDTEHMFDCPNQLERNQSDDSFEDLDFNRLFQQTFKKLSITPHKSLVAKKYYIKKGENPYLVGERLPVAAKKGNHVVY